MSIKGKFTISSGQMTGSYRERSFEYDVVQWIRQDEYTPHSQKLRTRIRPDDYVDHQGIKRNDLREAEAIYVKISGGTIDGEEYRYLWGPFFDGTKEIEEHLTDIFVYGSP